MKISVDEKKAEAVRRMKMLDIYPETIQQFEKQGLISISEPPLGAFFWAKEEDIEYIKIFEHRFNTLVYMIVRSYHSDMGVLDSYFYVSDYREEWESDVAMFKDLAAYVYVYNHTDPWCSEFGDIGILKTATAGIVRTW